MLNKIKLIGNEGKYLYLTDQDLAEFAQNGDGGRIIEPSAAVQSL